MQLVCEATQSTDDRVKVAAFETMVRIMQLYYDRMAFYMEQALYSLTIMGMKSDNEQVALQAIEFWSTVCDEEIDLNEQAIEAQELGEEPQRVSMQFAKKAMPEVLPVLLALLMKQVNNYAYNHQYHLLIYIYISIHNYRMKMPTMMIGMYQWLLPHV
jgi:importin subunit beta-1